MSYKSITCSRTSVEVVKGYFTHKSVVRMNEITHRSGMDGVEMFGRCRVVM